MNADPVCERRQAGRIKLVSSEQQVVLTDTCCMKYAWAPNLKNK